MKKIYYLLCVLFVVMACSKETQDETLTTVLTKEMEDRLVGEWYTLAYSVPDERIAWTNFFGVRLTFKFDKDYHFSVDGEAPAHFDGSWTVANECGFPFPMVKTGETAHTFGFSVTSDKLILGSQAQTIVAQTWC